MAKKVSRKNAGVLKWIRAAAFIGLTGWALTALSFTPGAAAWGIALVVGATALFAPGIAVLLAMIAMGIPLLAADFIAGAAFLVIGFASSQFLSEENGWPFLLILAAFVFATIPGGPVWAVAIIAGYIMGSSEGAVVGILAVLAIEVAGLLAGKPGVGLVHSGGAPTAALIDLAAGPANLLSFDWLSGALSDLDPNALIDTIGQAGGKTLLAIQPLLWGAGAAVVGGLVKATKDRSRPVFMIAAAGIGVVVLGVGSGAALWSMGDAPGTAALSLAIATSFVAALVYIAVWERVFPRVAAQQTAGARPGTMSSEDADVDELLRLIANAEDELATKHTTQATVMITDMKSFSKMTEEEGSFVSAKTIQRHRDLLLPVIERHGGRGKSTGGDGLVAAFPSESEAVSAAAEMQNLLRDRAETHSTERAIIIRIGIASGEVVLDKGGRPFIGNGLNLAARVMNLADGNQIFVTRGVAEKMGSVPGVSTSSHGDFALKNIAEPVPLVEVLWTPGQEPAAPLLQRD
ncbi:MAG: adenylate/guanylate cyclase domain-containing protein [Coriobacteriia bacterium]